MDMFVVRGGKPLQGRVIVRGSKNAALPIMAAALAADGTTTLQNVPDLVDVSTLSKVLETLGVQVEQRPAWELRITPRNSRPCVADYELVRRMRASVCVLGPLLGRRGAACVSLPGGCQIGHRPIDLHLKGLAALGADIRLENGYVHATAARLRGTQIHLAGPQGSTVTGTCNVMTAACFATGTTVITAAACEPEVVDLGNFLNQAGARISGLGTSTLEIRGTGGYQGTEYAIIPDRIEAATFLLAGAITGGDLLVEHLRPDHLLMVTQLLRDLGADITQGPKSLRIQRTGALRPLDIAAQPFPGLPTDVQAQFSAVLMLAAGTSTVIDHVFPDRFLHLPELARMGANVIREGQTARIEGVARLSGAQVMASDLRASAALLLAALAADGETTIRRVYHLDRGYERFEERLRGVGANISRKTDSPSTLPLEFSEIPSPSALPAPHFLSMPVAKATR